MGLFKLQINSINFYKINPYLTLGITKKTQPEQTKRIFRKKLLETKDNFIEKAKICMAYDIIVNNSVYKECEKDVYELKKETSDILPY